MAIDIVPWWKTAVVYQIYPASFKDSNNDGVGDIPGIIESLDYIQSLGATVIWVCPMYQSPQVDMGYDISDYESVHAPYGTVEDMETLIEKAHARGLRIILDLVINHTSDQHAWFKESRSSKDNAKRDWYIWRPAKYDASGNRQPPNNWRTNFGGSAWRWDESTEEYYLHLFCPEQPDLNWENEETRKAIYKSAMIFWLEKGIDGFRVDTVNMYSKPEGLPDAPIKDPGTPWQDAGMIYCNGPRMHEYLEEMNAILSRYGAMSVGECPCTPDMNKVVEYVSAEKERLNMVFQFDLVDVGMGDVTKYQTTPLNFTLADVKDATRRVQELRNGNDAWVTTFIENHDQARSISRFGSDSPKWRNRSGKALALLTASLSGTLFMYQGQELGMINMPRTWGIEEYKDVDSINFYNEVAERSGNSQDALTQVLDTLQHLARDHARLPMQWSSAENGGFTGAGVKPWMRAHPSAQEGINVAEENNDKSSVMWFWRRMLQVRDAHQDTLVHGTFELIDDDNASVFAFSKTSACGQKKALAMCNLSGQPTPMPDTSGFDLDALSIVLQNIDGQAGRPTDGLEPWECRLYA